MTRHNDAPTVAAQQCDVTPAEVGGLITELCDAAYRNAGPAGHEAELVTVKAERDKWREAFGSMHRQTMTAEAQLAEARKALEPFAREVDGWDADQNDGFVFHDTERLDGEHRLNVGHLRAARRALTGGKNG